MQDTIAISEEIASSVHEMYQEFIETGEVKSKVKNYEQFSNLIKQNLLLKSYLKFILTLISFYQLHTCLSTANHYQKNMAHSMFTELSNHEISI